jgi:hypothetical protein
LRAEKGDIFSLSDLLPFPVKWYLFFAVLSLWLCS